MDPTTFTLIVTALSGLSAVLSIGQTGIQFSRSNKKVNEIVENEYFLDLSTIKERQTRNEIKDILEELRRITPHANYTIKTLQRHIMARVVMYSVVWVAFVVSIAWTLPPLADVSVFGVSVSEYFVLTLLLVSSVVLLNGFLPGLAKRIGLQKHTEHWREVDFLKYVKQFKQYRETMSERASVALRVFGFRALSEQEKELLESYMSAVEALRVVQTRTFLASLKLVEERALKIVGEEHQGNDA